MDFIDGLVLILGSNKLLFYIQEKWCYIIDTNVFIFCFSWITYTYYRREWHWDSVKTQNLSSGITYEGEKYMSHP